MAINTLGLLLTIGSMIASGISNYSKQQKADKYKKKLDQKADQDYQMESAEARRAAISRAINSKNSYAPYIREPNPIAPSTEAEDITTGVSGVTGQLGGMMMNSNAGMRQKPVSNASTSKLNMNTNSKYDPYRYA